MAYHFYFYVIGNSYHIKRSARMRTAAEKKYVAKATRCRRRILQAGFLYIRKHNGDIIPDLEKVFS